MHHPQQPARTPRTRVEPHHLHHHTRHRVQSAPRRVRLHTDQLRQHTPVPTRHINPPHTPLDRNRTNGPDLKTPTTISLDQQPQPQSVVMIHHTLNRRRQRPQTHTTRHRHQHRLMETTHTRAQPPQPLHHRRHHHLTHTTTGQIGRTGHRLLAALLQLGGHGLDGLQAEDVAGAE